MNMAVNTFHSLHTQVEHLTQM